MPVPRLRPLLIAGVVAGSAAGGELADAKAAARQAQADWDRAVRDKADGRGGDIAVSAAEARTYAAKAEVARLVNDADGERRYRHKVTAAARDVLTAVERMHGRGLMSAEEVDLARRAVHVSEAAAADAAADRPAEVAARSAVLAVERRRLARAEKLLKIGAVVRADVDARRDAVAEAEDRLRRAEERAPVAGRK